MLALWIGQIQAGDVPDQVAAVNQVGNFSTLLLVLWE